MAWHLSITWKRLRHALTADPGRFAGGSAVTGPLALLAAEAEQPADGRSERATRTPR